VPFSEKQTDFFVESNHSFNIATGAVSSGKTHVSTLRWFQHIYDVPDGVLLLMSGKTSESLYDNVIRQLVALHPADLRLYRSPMRVVVRSKGIEIACADANNEASWGRIQGKTVFGWLADEVTQYPESFTKMAQSRCRGDGKVWPKFWTCNPGTPQHYIKTDYINNTDLDVGLWEFTLDDNPVLSSEYIEEVKASYSGVYYDRYILGKWVHAEGMVYDEWSRENHVVAPFEIPKHWRRIRVIDWGYTNPFVCLWIAIDEDGRAYVYDEHYRSRTLIKDHAEAIQTRTGTFEATIADHDAQDNAELRQHGIVTRNADKDIEAGLQKVKSRLQLAGDNRPRLMVFSSCASVIREMELYRWPTSREGRNEKEQPLKENDHAMDALRYGVMYLDGGKKPGVLWV